MSNNFLDYNIMDLPKDNKVAHIKALSEIRQLFIDLMDVFEQSSEEDIYIQLYNQLDNYMKESSIQPAAEVETLDMEQLLLTGRMSCYAGFGDLSSWFGTSDLQGYEVYTGSHPLYPESEEEIYYIARDKNKQLRGYFDTLSNSGLLEFSNFSSLSAK